MICYQPIFCFLAPFVPSLPLCKRTMKAASSSPSIGNHCWIDNDTRAPYYHWMVWDWYTVGRFSTTIVVVHKSTSRSVHLITYGFNSYLDTIVCANIPSIGNSHRYIDWYIFGGADERVGALWGWFWIRHSYHKRTIYFCIVQKIEWNNEPANPYQLPYHITNDY